MPALNQYAPERDGDTPEAPTLRDHLACQVLHGLIVETPQRNRADDLARDAYLYADAMLSARSQ